MVIKRSRRADIQHLVADHATPASESTATAAEQPPARPKVHRLARPHSEGPSALRSSAGEAPVAKGLSDVKRQLMEPRLTLHQVLVPARADGSEGVGAASPMANLAVDNWSLGPSQETAQRRQELLHRIQNLAAVIDRFRDPANRQNPASAATLWQDLSERMRELRAELLRPWRA